MDDKGASKNAPSTLQAFFDQRESVQAMGLEPSVMAEQLHYLVQFLPPIPEEEQRRLVGRFVLEAHQLFVKVELNEQEVDDLLKRWFDEGKQYEGEMVPVPSGIEAVLNSLRTFEIKQYFPRFSTDLDCLCRLIWAWFQRGRVFERGNASTSDFFSEGRYFTD